MIKYDFDRVSMDGAMRGHVYEVRSEDVPVLRIHQNYKSTTIEIKKEIVCVLKKSNWAFRYFDQSGRKFIYRKFTLFTNELLVNEVAYKMKIRTGGSFWGTENVPSARLLGKKC